MLPMARKGKMIDSYQENNQKRNFHLLGESKLKSYERLSLTSKSHAVNKVNSFDVPPRRIGKDRHYYECVVCDIGGDLLCCDTCPNTYHLQCLNPPLELVPPGNWQCDSCRQAGYLLTPSSHLQNLEGNATSNQNATSRVGDKKEGETSPAVKEIKVYRRRRVRKKDVEQEDNDRKKLTRVYDPSLITNGDKKDIPATDTSESFNPSSIVPDSAAHTNNVLERDPSASRLHRPKESKRRPVEHQGGDAAHPAVKGTVCIRSPNANHHDKLLILRDAMQESMKEQYCKQNSVGRDLQKALPPNYTESSKAKKEKFARLRARQKQKLALRYRSTGLIHSSEIGRQEPLFRLHSENLGESVKEEKTATLKLYKSSNQIFGLSNCFQNVSGITDPRRSQYWQNKFGGKFPSCSSHQASDAECSTRSRIGMIYRENSNSDTSTQKPIPRIVSGGGRGLLLISSPSNLSSTSQLRESMTKKMSNNLRKDEAIVDDWSEDELDSLWVGIRRHGAGNWELMLRNPFLSFSKHKTVKDLSRRWTKERLKLLIPALSPSSEN